MFKVILRSFDAFPISDRIHLSYIATFQTAKRLVAIKVTFLSLCGNGPSRASRPLGLIFIELLLTRSPGASCLLDKMADNDHIKLVKIEGP